MALSWTAAGLTRLSCCLVFSMWFVQNVGATSHPEIVIDLSEPPEKKNALIIVLHKFPKM